VSFDVELLKKEYKKSLKILKRDEILKIGKQFEESIAKAEELI